MIDLTEEVGVVEEKIFSDPKPREKGLGLCQDRRMKLADGRGWITHSTYNSTGGVKTYLLRVDDETDSSTSISAPQVSRSVVAVKRRFILKPLLQDIIVVIRTEPQWTADVVLAAQAADMLSVSSELTDAEGQLWLRVDQG